MSFGLVERKRLNHAGLSVLCKLEVAGSIPARSKEKGAGNGAFPVVYKGERGVNRAAVSNPPSVAPLCETVATLATC